MLVRCPRRPAACVDAHPTIAGEAPPSSGPPLQLAAPTSIHTLLSSRPSSLRRLSIITELSVCHSVSGLGVWFFLRWPGAASWQVGPSFMHYCDEKCILRSLLNLAIHVEYLAAWRPTCRRRLSTPVLEQAESTFACCRAKGADASGRC